MALSRKTATKLDEGLALLAIEQSLGIGPVGEVSIAEIAKRAGVSESTVATVEKIALAKLAAGLIDRGLPPNLARKVSRILNPN